MSLLQKEILPSLKDRDIHLPADDVWQLPETVLQFGTGVLLRGLPDYYMNKANNEGIFNGRVVVVKSTGKGNGNAFAEGDNLYTHCIKGIEPDGSVTETYIINAAISRVLNAGNEWNEVIALAASPQLQVVISNTTEVGIALDETDEIDFSPPRSFPGKLLAFLKARYDAFAGSADSGLVIIPTELIVDNGAVLKEIVHRLAQINNLEEPFISWLLNANDWCSSLVDRIVPGALPEADQQKLAETFGYKDSLAIMSEPYSLWAIETKKQTTKQILSFYKADSSVIITDNIDKYRELKLRLLNATHTFCCGLAFLTGFDTVNQAVQDEAFYRFVHRLMHREIVPCLMANGIDREEANTFAGTVLKRFANPFIHHRWLSISLQYTGKMKMRCLPLITRYYQEFTALPVCMTIGFSAYLAFMKVVLEKDGKYYGERNGAAYPVEDEKAALFHAAWQSAGPAEAIRQMLDASALWGNEIALPLFSDEVTKYALQLLNGASLQEILPGGAQ